LRYEFSIFTQAHEFVTTLADVSMINDKCVTV